MEWVLPWRTLTKEKHTLTLRKRCLQIFHYEFTILELQINISYDEEECAFWTLITLYRFSVLVKKFFLYFYANGPIWSLGPHRHWELPGCWFAGTLSPPLYMLSNHISPCNLYRLSSIIKYFQFQWYRCALECRGANNYTI